MCTVTVVLQPQAVGQRTATVMVTSNGGSPTVALTGSASNRFSVTPSGPTTATVGPGQPAMYRVSFTPSTTFSGTATFTCTVAPAGPGCTLTPAMVQVTASNNPTPTPVSVVATPTATATVWQLRDFTDSSTRPVALPPAFATAWLLAFFCFAPQTWFATRKSWNADVASHRFRFSRVRVVIAIAAICSIAACGGSGSTTKQPQNYTVTFTAMSGATKQTVRFMLTVN
jgi:hypothetical protein